jgi:hypothetical protein
LEGRHGFQDIELGNAGFHDGSNSPEQRKRAVTVAIFQRNLQCLTLVQNLLEPEFIHLVDGDEQQLIVLRTIGKWLLEF